MELEAQSDGRWLARGQTYAHRDKLKALGGRWQPEEKGWLLPASVDAEEILRLGGVAKPQHPARTKLRNMADPTAVLASDVKIWGDTFEHRDTLKSMGAYWDKAHNHWLISGTVNKNALEELLDDAGVEWHYFRPRSRQSGLSVRLGFDQERHRLLSSECTCSDVTCDVCSYACCAQAVPYSAEELAAQRWVGVQYRCPRHGHVMHGTDD